jgi:protein-L-isoaspartate(D-aspartate) O-methyltransferase
MRLWFLCLLALSLFKGSPDAFERERTRMVEDQIKARGVHDSETLRAMMTVERHAFVPPDEIDNAYDDRPLPIGYGQTISQPYIVAYMTELVQPHKASRVLEIGTGSGYQAAVLAEIVDSVFTIEIITELFRAATERLHRLKYGNIRTRNADGYFGWKDRGPFDVIVVTAAAEHIPPPLIEQLKEGGRMIIPVGSPWFVQTLMLVEKERGEVRTRSLIPVRFVPLTRG